MDRTNINKICFLFGANFVRHVVQKNTIDGVFESTLKAYKALHRLQKNGNGLPDKFHSLMKKSNIPTAAKVREDQKKVQMIIKVCYFIKYLVSNKS